MALTNHNYHQLLKLHRDVNKEIIDNSSLQVEFDQILKQLANIYDEYLLNKELDENVARLLKELLAANPPPKFERSIFDMEMMKNEISEIIKDSLILLEYLGKKNHLSPNVVQMIKDLFLLHPPPRFPGFNLLAFNPTK